MNVEKLAAKFHEIYQKEAKKQGDIRHSDEYEDLSENIKEFDRVLARYVIKFLETETLRTLKKLFNKLKKEKWTQNHLERLEILFKKETN